jgi:hypothetical protein
MQSRHHCLCTSQTQPGKDLTFAEVARARMMVMPLGSRCPSNGWFQLPLFAVDAAVDVWSEMVAGVVVPLGMVLHGMDLHGTLRQAFARHRYYSCCSYPMMQVIILGPS